MYQDQSGNRRQQIVNTGRNALCVVMVALDSINEVIATPVAKASLFI
jgi:hypothetical protein